MRLLFVIGFTVSLLSLCRGDSANLVLLNDAPTMGAMCLDGSPPGYYFRPGSGSGANSWIIHLEGGGWCYNEQLCVTRSKTALGSSKSWAPTVDFTVGLLGDDKVSNPDFYNWNMAFVAYCDGASFAGNVDKPVVWNGTSLYFRGFPILQAVLQSLMNNGMKNAEAVILTGCSAGGLATYLHADYVASVIPQTAKYHAIADAGFFIDALNVHGQPVIRGDYQYVYKMQNCSGGVNQDCIKDYTSKNETWKCFMAQYTEPYIKSPLFGLNSMYDSWQLANIFQLPCSIPNCPSNYTMDFYSYRSLFLQAARDFTFHQGRGYFFDSCITHCQSLSESWNKIMINNQSAQVTFGNWYFGRTDVSKEIDCPVTSPSPCNKSC